MIESIFIVPVFGLCSGKGLAERGFRPQAHYYDMLFYAFRQSNIIYGSMRILAIFY